MRTEYFKTYLKGPGTYAVPYKRERKWREILQFGATRVALNKTKSPEFLYTKMCYQRHGCLDKMSPLNLSIIKVAMHIAIYMYGYVLSISVIVNIPGTFTHNC